MPTQTSEGGQYRVDMAYPRRLLNDHETVVVDLHPHWWCLVKPIALLVGAMAASIAVLLQTDAETMPRDARRAGRASA